MERRKASIVAAPMVIRLEVSNNFFSFQDSGVCVVIEPHLFAHVHRLVDLFRMHMCIVPG